jgi:hypothetical protein
LNNTFIKDDYFKIDPEAHAIGDMENIKHFPGVQMWWRAITHIDRALGYGMPAYVMEGL